MSDMTRYGGLLNVSGSWVKNYYKRILSHAILFRLCIKSTCINISVWPASVREERGVLNFAITISKRIFYVD